MPRLRLSATLSLLALLIGVVGTGWLSALTGGWAGPAMLPSHPPSSPGRSYAHVHHRRRATAAGGMRMARAARPSAPLPAPPLVPLSTPPDPAPYVQLRGHLDGRVVLDIATDRSGRVSSLDLRQSSGDPILDAHALATVRRWRFAVPPGSPGVQGELPMRFDSGTHDGALQ